MKINHREIFNPVNLLGVSADSTFANCVRALQGASTKDIDYASVDEQRIIRMISKRLYELFINDVFSEGYFNSNRNYKEYRESDSIVITYANEFGTTSMMTIPMDVKGLHGFVLMLTEGGPFKVNLSTER